MSQMPTTSTAPTATGANTAIATATAGATHNNNNHGTAADNEVPNLTQQRIAVGDEGNEMYNFISAIGKGGYADVYKVQSKDNSNFACKAIPKSRLTSTSKMNKVKMEIAIHKSLDHENIVKFFSTFENETFIFIVLEYCQHRSMNILIKQRMTLTDPEVRYFLVQVMDALAYLHSKRIIHRDLKAGNILLKGSSALTIKLCDFGLSALLTHDNERRKTMCGTPNYIAPEILSNSGHSYEADVWSLACLMFALITGKPPFQTRPIREIYARVVSAKYRPHAVPDKLARDLIRSTLVTDPENRPALSAFRNHAYFNEWTPGEIGLEVYDDCPTNVKEYIRNHQSTSSSQSERGRNRGTTSSNNTGHLRNYAMNAGGGNHQQGGATGGANNNGGGGHAALQPLDRRSSQEYLSVVTNITDSERLPPRENVVLRYDEMNADGVKLTEKIADCLRNWKATNNLRHIAKIDTALIWAIKWVDYSDTDQGFGYQLSDGSYGVLFQNETKMMLLSDENTIFFLARRDAEYRDSESTINDDMRLAKRRLETFVNYMKSNLVGFNIENIRNRFPTRTINDQPFPITWTRGWDDYNDHDREYLIIIVIRPAIYQINFEDHSKVIIDYNKGNPIIMYQKDGAIALLTELATLGQMGFTEDLKRKLQIANESFIKITTPAPI